MRMTKVGGGTENHLVLNKSRTKKACIKQYTVCHFVSFSLWMHTCAFFAITQVTLIAKILAYNYLFQTGCMAMSAVIRYYCRYCVAFIL